MGRQQDRCKCVALSRFFNVSFFRVSSSSFIVSRLQVPYGSSEIFASCCTISATSVTPPRARILAMRLRPRFLNACFVPNCVWPSSSLLRIELELRDCNRASAFSVASPHLLALVSPASKPELLVSLSIYCTRVAVTRLLRSFRVAIDRGTSSLDRANHIEPSDRHEAVDWCSRIEAKVEGIEASSLASSHRALRLRRTGDRE
ncbi:hypothetical protein F2Q70_00017971 [Brassica cretica]|uniref:Uncharacterized protein n=1 Tax=Brassica cretica TaxID=69181 RepID=A0A8S9KSW0_BRACR|nr:hypothetical protein F2Q70_00017971 [Brassica cretica]KAF2596861.1 hypothetical protein F2Q68_00010950 [Brassica cretica]